MLSFYHRIFRKLSNYNNRKVFYKSRDQINIEKIKAIIIMNKSFRSFSYIIWIIIAIAAIAISILISILLASPRYSGFMGGLIGYSCPDVKFVDCMPKVIMPGETPPASPVPCSGEYHEWIKRNCDVEFVW